MRPLLIVIGLALTGCTAVTVRSVDSAVGLRHVCIKENPKVAVGDFLGVVRDAFDRHSISTQVFTSDDPPTGCEYVLTYTALRNWDLGMYLYHAELRLEKDHRQVAYAEYHLRGKGGLALNKWAGTRSKMDPVLDELLKNYATDR